MILTTENNSDRNLRCCAVRILKKLLPGKQMGKETKVNQISQTLQELKRGESELKPIAKLACWLTLLLEFHARHVTLALFRCKIQNFKTNLRHMLALNLDKIKN